MTTGDDNVAIGMESLYCNNTGNGNVSIGWRSMAGSAGSATGAMVNNVAVGTEAFRYPYAASNLNVAVGNRALYNLETSGSEAVTGTVGVGYYSGGTAYNADYCVYLGTYAGYTNHTDDRLFIHSSAADVGTAALIYGEFDNGLVGINGDLCVGGITMSGTELLRVVGDARIEGKLTVTGTIDPTDLVLDEQADHPTAPAAGTGILWVRDDAPNVLVFTDDAGTDWELNASSSSDWSKTGIVIHPTTLTDQLSLGSATTTINEKFQILDERETGATFGQITRLDVTGTNAKTTWTGQEMIFNHSSTATATNIYGYSCDYAVTAGTVTNLYGFRIPIVSGGGTITTAYGLYIDNMQATTQWGVYQNHEPAENYFCRRYRHQVEHDPSVSASVR